VAQGGRSNAWPYTVSWGQDFQSILIEKAKIKAAKKPFSRLISQLSYCFWDSVILSLGLPTWQLFLSHVDMPSLGNIYACSKSHTATSIRIHQPPIQSSLLFGYASTRILVLSSKTTGAAHGCLNQPAQENPLEGEAQPDENPLLNPLSDEPHEKEDICLHVSFSPQEGQTGFMSPSEGKTSCSNTFSHLLHLNS
jgi:hypothetical protein